MVITVSVVMPSLNEENTIGICINKVLEVFKKYNIDGEIIVSDNSTDRSPEIARSLGAKVITPKKRGYGNAYIEAFKHAKGKYIVLADADNTYDLSEVPKFLEPLMDNKADLVIGNRFKGNILNGAMPWLHRYIGNPLLTKTLKMLFKVKVSDAHCGMRAITKPSLEKMNLKMGGMEFASEMIIEASRKKQRIMEVPINYYPRIAKSKLRSFRDGWRHLRFMMLYSPNVIFLVPGSILFIIGLILTILLASGPFTLGSMVMDIHPLVLANLMLIVGFQIIIFGLYTKIYGVINGIIEQDRIIQLFLNYHSLEKELITGFILLLIGIGIDLKIILYWISKGMGELAELRNAIIASSIASIGIQMIFSALFISVLMLDKCVVRGEEW